jgi:catecholate siderophore receptor
VLGGVGPVDGQGTAASFNSLYGCELDGEKNLFVADTGNNAVRLAQVPKHQASLWNRYELSDAFAAGVGIIHQSSQYAAIRTSATTTKLPAFTRVDAALYYDVSDRFQLQLNVENLFDTAYYSDAHNNNNISTGAPINGRFTVRAKF